MMKKFFKKFKVIRKFYQYYLDVFVYGPNFFRKNLIADEGDKVACKLAKLKDNGFIQLAHFLDKNYAEILKEKVDEEIQESKTNEDRVVYSELQKYYRVKSPFLLDDKLLYYATHPDLYLLIERYFKNKVYLADVDLRVIPPTNIKDIEANMKKEHGESNYSSSHWHYDIRGKQIKVMVYLSDVSHLDNKFMCVSGTHKVGKKSLDYESSRFEDEEVDAMDREKVECLGEAGSTYLFDTNIIHRLNRSDQGSVRYSVTFYYTSGRHLRDMYVTKSAFNHLDDVSKRMLEGNSGSRVHFK